ncbi:MAG TPA: hypothetical protein VMK13_18590 [Streptosporangiaceae bacterium]|nr:hypothetical protein [Streptosporangiaceae bacterium]
MNVRDEMSDNDVLRTASDALSAIPMAKPPDVEAIKARGRARRRHWLSAVAGFSVAGAAAGIALALGLTGVLGRAPAPGTIRTAAFTLVGHSDGTATLTISPKELLDPAALQSDLAQYGIPAKVAVGRFCWSDPAPAGFSQVVSFYPAGEYTVTPQSKGMHPTITIDPAAMPAGTELSVGDFQLSTGQQQADFALIDTTSYTCSSTPPGPNGPPDGHGLLYGGPGTAGS